MLKTDPFQAGFSLLELMMAVAIVGMLAALAIPQYQDYSARARMTEAVQMLAAARVSVAEYAMTHGAMPASAASAGVGALESRVVERLAYEARAGSAYLTVKVRHTGSAEADGRHFSLIGELPAPGAAPVRAEAGGVRVQGVISWRCRPGDAAGKDPVPDRFLPANCRSAPV